LSNFLHLLPFASVSYVAWTANHHFTLGHTISGLNSAHLTVLVVHNFIDILVQNKSSSVNGAHPGKSFRNASKTVNWIQKGGITISAMGIHIKFNFIDRFNGGSLQEIVIGVQSYGVTNKVNGVVFQTKLFNNCLKRLFFNINALPSFLVIIF
jgi:hypothetical protein